MDYLLRRFVNILVFTFQHMALTIQLVSQCIQIRLSLCPFVFGSHESYCRYKYKFEILQIVLG